MHIFFSNQYEKLAKRLGERLFSFSDTPLKKRYVVVNSNYVKEYLLKFFADHFQISSCIYFVTLKEALSLFYSKKFPTKYEMFFSLLAKLKSLPDKYEQLCSYLEGEQKEKKILSLSHSLSQFFFDFALFPKNATHSWQEDLFHEIAEVQGWPTFTYLWEEMKDLTHAELHLFDWDYLPKSYTLFFGKASIPIYYYLLSPCMHYWGDDLSDRELIRRKLLNFEERNPILSNLGMMQRKFLSFLDEFDFQGEEEYQENDGTALQKVQKQILHASSMKEKEEEAFDDSIQIFPASSKLQEVEILYKKLAALYSEGDLSWEDVLVLAPDITPYLPFIRFVFSDQCVHSKKEDSYSVFLQILELSQKDGEVEEVLKILEAPACQKKLSIGCEDLDEIKGWLKETHTRFGFGYEPHSWEQFFFKLFSGLLFEGPSMIDLSLLPLIDKLSRFIQCLKEDLFFLQKNPKFTLCEWGEFFEKLVEKYFALESISFNFLYLKKTPLSGIQFDFRSMLYFLQKEEKRPFIGGEISIRFASLEEGSCLPAKVICLLGMEEGAFPRFSRGNSLNPLAGHFKSIQEEDRYLFLRTILMAKNRLLIFYKSFSEEDGRSVFPSPLLQELLRYIKIPIIPSPNLSPSTCKESKEEIFCLPPSTISALEEKHVSLAELVKLSKDPWKFYLHSLRIFLEKNEIHEFQMGEFLFSKLDHYLLRKNALSSSWEEEIEKAEKKGLLPVSLFGASTKEELKKEFQEWEEELRSLGLQKEELFSVHFSLNTRVRNGTCLPPLKISDTLLAGEIPFIYKDGLLLMEKEGKEVLYQYLPLLCAYLLLPSDLRPEKPKIYFSKSLTVSELKIDKPEAILAAFLTYYQNAKKELFPFRPELMEGFIKKDPELLQKAIDNLQKKHPFPNPYLEFVLKDKTLPTGEKLLAVWGDHFGRFFGSLS